MEMHEGREVADSLVVAPVLRRFEQRLTKETKAETHTIARIRKPEAHVHARSRSGADLYGIPDPLPEADTMHKSIPS